MKYQKVLKNNNKIASDTTCQKQQMQMADNLSIRFVFSGSETYHIGKRQLAVHPDTFLILNEDTQFTSRIDAIDPVQSFALTFDRTYLSDFLRSQTLTEEALLANPADKPVLYNFEETLYPLKGDMRYNLLHLKEQTERGLQDEFLLNEYLYHCLINYYKVYQEEIFDKEARLTFLNHSTKIEILRRLNLAKEYMLGNYDQSISLDDIAEYACLSVNHFLRTFKQAFDMSPHQYLTKVRLQRARHLIKTTNMPINEIVHLVGFECPSSFIRLFKSKYHTTPLQYKLTA
ncbi:AraC family transcriptional regulator [Mucilaginibacter sp. PAMB04274]|uniref:AraC family transcriptional regulator n=1 Tax=Mucilaginibacter sp. PAMB04274 TaxID=3138568 RepID=UPI0031F62214